MEKKFQRRKEDFVCEQCGTRIVGTGYTNHCPKCLWSKHADVHPGDRAAMCGGMMPPVDVEVKGGSYVLLHRCEKCGFQRKNKVVMEDDFNAVLAISKKQ